MGTVNGPVLAFKRHLRAEVREGAAYLFSEQGVIAMRGAQIASLATLLDGTHDLDDLRRAQPEGMAPTEITKLVARLVDAGLVAMRRPADEPADERTLAYWDACGIDAGAAAARQRTSTVRLLTVGDGMASAQVGQALAGAGLEVVAPDEAAELSVVLCEDYLDPRLAAVDAAHRRSGRPWLLARPFGAQVWIGPVLQPAAMTGCWHCLTHRLWGNRHAEACVQAVLGHDGPARRPVSALPPLTAAAANLVALEASKWLAGYRHHGQGSVWVLDTLDLQGSLHELRRRPQCEACGDAGLTAARGARRLSLKPAKKATSTGGGHRTMTAAQVLDRYRHLISPVTGIIKEIKRDPGAPAFVNASLSGMNVARGVTGLTGLAAGLRGQNGGKGVSPIDAEVGALCEAVERFSGNYQGDELRIRGSLRSLGAEAIHPNDCLLYDERQYRTRAEWNPHHAPFQHVCEPFDEDAELDWTPVWSLSGRRRLLPTGSLYYGAPREVAPASVRADSNGAAAGSSLEDAILQGTLELIERDAVALWWYNRTPMPGVDLATFGDPWLDEMTGHYAGLGRTMWVLDLTSDLGVPVFVALSRRLGDGPEQIMLGFGAHLDPRIAVRRAVTELNQLLPWTMSGRETTDPDANRWLREATVAGHPYLLRDPRVRPRVLADFDLTHRADVCDDLNVLSRSLADQGLELFVLDQTRADVDLPVVKVIVPGLRSFWARFGPGRLFDVPVRLGRLAAPTPYEELNPYPLFL